MKKDNYTSFKFKAYVDKAGYLVERAQMGNSREESAYQKILGNHKHDAAPGSQGLAWKMVMPYSINQVSTASMFQYRWDEKETVLGGTITATDFTSGW